MAAAEAIEAMRAVRTLGELYRAGGIALLRDLSLVRWFERAFLARLF